MNIVMFNALHAKKFWFSIGTNAQSTDSLILRPKLVMKRRRKRKKGKKGTVSWSHYTSWSRTKSFL